MATRMDVLVLSRFFFLRFAIWVETHVPDRKRKTILERSLSVPRCGRARVEVNCSYTNACGNRTLAPYTATFRADLMIDSSGARSGLSKMRFATSCLL